MYQVKKELYQTGMEMRKAAFNGLAKVFDENDKAVILDADLASASGFIKFKENYEDRFIQCGIAEANMCGVACGMSTEGFTPYIHSFAPFVSRRIFDQLFLSGAYAHNNVNVIATDPGFCTAANGGTHTTFEDIAMMRTIPNIHIYEASDPVLLEWIIQEVNKTKGVNYIRTTRKAIETIYEEGSTFEIGKGNVVREGKDVLLISSGESVSDCLKASDLLAKEGIDCEVVDMFTIKPIDKELILKDAANKKLVMSVENHSVNGGLGSAVAEVIAENNCDVNFVRHGIVEEFGQVGTVDYLKKAFKLDAESIANKVKESL